MGCLAAGLSCVLAVGCGPGGDAQSRSVAGAPVGREAPAAPAPTVYLDFERALSAAAERRQPVFVHFTAEWCQPCKELKRTVYPQADVARRLDSFVRAEVDIDTPEGKKLARRYTVQTVPVLMIFDAGGNELRSLRTVGATTPERLVTALDRALEQTTAETG